MHYHKKILPRGGGGKWKCRNPDPDNRLGVLFERYSRNLVHWPFFPLPCEIKSYSKECVAVSIIICPWQKPISNWVTSKTVNHFQILPPSSKEPTKNSNLNVVTFGQHYQTCNILLRLLDTSLCSKNSNNLHPLDILAFYSANKPCFHNQTKSLFVQCSIDVKNCNFTCANRCYFNNVTTLF